MLCDLYPSEETDCKHPELIHGSTWAAWAGTNAPMSSYGNGLIQFFEKSFCSYGVCKNVTVCQTVDVIDGVKYYVPLRVDTANRRSQELDKNNNLVKTTWRFQFSFIHI